MRFLPIFLALALPLLAAEPFEIKDGDRVVLLGDALLERENTYGYLETRMHEQFPDRNFTVRNISWAGDTPRGWSRASFDPAEKGMDRLREAIELTKPTVVFLGYGMAASLQEMTDRAQDPTLNPDPARYGREPMSAARFKKELGELMTLIAEVVKENAKGSAGFQPAEAGILPGSSSRAGAATLPSEKNGAGRGGVERPAGMPDAAGRMPALPVRFVLLSPIRHEDLRAQRAGLPDPAPHNALLEQYSKAIEELAKERGAGFVSLKAINPRDSYPGLPKVANGLPLGSPSPLTANGIHLSLRGHNALAAHLAAGFDSRTEPANGWLAYDGRESLRGAVLRKNAVFFHRFRPANLTYLTGFRKHEQGQNAKEIAEFDALVAAADAEIDRLKRPLPTGNGTTENAERAEAGKGSVANTSDASPSFRVLRALRGENQFAAPRDFTVLDGYQIELWAENPHLEKPTQMNWDAQGRLWVASSSTYPQVDPQDVAITMARTAGGAGGKRSVASRGGRTASRSRR